MKKLPESNQKEVPKNISKGSFYKQFHEISLEEIVQKSYFTGSCLSNSPKEVVLTKLF